jgi:hypothetical protein
MSRLIIVFFGTLLAACFNPNYGPNGDVQCGANGACPPGFHCAADNRCYGAGINPDLGSAAPDMTDVSLPDMIYVPPPVHAKPFWVASGGGQCLGQQSGNRLNLSIGGTVAAGRAVGRTSGSSATLGYLNGDSNEQQ